MRANNGIEQVLGDLEEKPTLDANRMGLNAKPQKLRPVKVFVANSSVVMA